MNDMESNVYAMMATKIIAEQSKIIGPVAYSQAGKVPGLIVDKSTHSATIQGDGAHVLDSLVGQYKLFFGDVAVEVSKEAVGNLRSSLTPEKVPSLLR
jgi:hypothetical protein